jgi:hypothetical protein
MPTSIQVERWAPTWFACATTLAWWWFDGEISEAFAKELLAAILSAAAVAAGFLTTALSILLPIATSTTGERLRRSGYDRDLFKYMRSAIWSCMFLAAVAVIAFFTLKGGKPAAWVSALLIYTSSHSAVALVRVAEILMSVFERASQPDDKDG